MVVRIWLADTEVMCEREWVRRGEDIEGVGEIAPVFTALYLASPDILDLTLIGRSPA